MYATDASPYEILPLCVVLPLDRRDVVETVKFAHRNAIPITARGGGSGLAGAALGHGLVIDLSRYMNKVSSIQ
jgi:FAD/FMN-containing dehydrogenase